MNVSPRAPSRSPRSRWLCRVSRSRNASTSSAPRNGSAVSTRATSGGSALCRHQCVASGCAEYPSFQCRAPLAEVRDHVLRPLHRQVRVDRAHRARWPQTHPLRAFLIGTRCCALTITIAQRTSSSTVSPRSPPPHTTNPTACTASGRAP